MATKDCFLSFKKDNIFVDNLNGQYNNLNLNQNYQSSSNGGFTDASKIVTTGFTEVSNYASTKSSDYEHYTKSNNVISSRADGLKLGYNSENQDVEDKRISSDFKDTTKSNSTLSLHITAYENFSEASSKNTSSVKSEGKKTGKKCKTAKQLFVNGPSFENPFELPRQRENEATVPEVMQFRRSQRLLNQSNSAAGNRKMWPGTFALSRHHRQTMIIYYGADVCYEFQIQDGVRGYCGDCQEIHKNLPEAQKALWTVSGKKLDGNTFLDNPMEGHRCQGYTRHFLLAQQYTRQLYTETEGSGKKGPEIYDELLQKIRDNHDDTEAAQIIDQLKTRDSLIRSFRTNATKK